MSVDVDGTIPDPELPQEVPATPAEREPVADVAALQAQIELLTDELSSARRRSDDASMVARRQSEMADELHAENRRLREGEVREAIAPLIRGLARLSDDLSRMRDPDGRQSADVTFIDARIEELLHDAGVVTVRPPAGEPFDPVTHRATGSTPTGDPTLDRCVAELRRAGLRRDDGRILRPADVVVYRHVATELTTSMPTQATTTTEHAS